jgi:hypothetical protein
MNNKTLIPRLLLLTLLLLLLMPPALAQEATEAPTPTLEVVTGNPVVEAPAPEVSYLDEGTLLIAGSILLTVVVGGSFFLAIKSLEALKVSVPQQTITEVGTQLVSVMAKTMAGVKTQVEATPSPIDDAFYAVAKIPVDFLITEIQRRTLTEEQRASIVSVVQRKDTEMNGIG